MMTLKMYAYTNTGKLYIISIVMDDLSTIMIGWENSEYSARKVVRNLDRFYPHREPKYVVIDKACKESTPLIQKQIWYKRVNGKYEEFAGLRLVDNEQA